MSNLCLIRSAAKSPRGASEQSENLLSIFYQTRDWNIRMVPFLLLVFSLENISVEGIYLKECFK